MKDSMGNDLHAPEAYLNQICSVSELKRRLVPHLEDSKCDRIISTMTQVAKVSPYNCILSCAFSIARLYMVYGTLWGNFPDLTSSS